MEAFHWRYHPYAAQIRSVIDSGVLGRLDRIEAVFDIPDGRIPRNDIRWDLGIGGGATMDLGCYSIQWARFAAGSDPDVVSAEAVCPVPGIDGSLVAELRWPSGVTGSVGSSMIAEGDSVVAYLKVAGELGTMMAANPLAPQNGGAVITVETAAGTRRYEGDRSSTYFHQLVAFRDHDQRWRGVSDDRRRRRPQHGDRRRLLPGCGARAPADAGVTPVRSARWFRRARRSRRRGATPARSGRPSTVRRS